MKLHRELTGEDLHAPRRHVNAHKTGGSDALLLTDIGGMVTEAPDAKLLDNDHIIYALGAIIQSLETKLDMVAQAAGIEFPDDS